MKAYTKHRPLGIFALLGFGTSILLALVAAAATDAPPAPSDAEDAFPQNVALFIDQHCATCHNDTDQEGDLDITALKFTPDDPANLKMWEKIYDQTETGDMPPKEKRRPKPAQLKDFLGKLGAAIKVTETKK